MTVLSFAFQRLATVATVPTALKPLEKLMILPSASKPSAVRQADSTTKDGALCFAASSNR